MANNLVEVHPSGAGDGKFFWSIPSMSLWSANHFDTEAEASSEGEQVFEEAHRDE